MELIYNHSVFAFVINHSRNQTAVLWISTSYTYVANKKFIDTGEPIS